MARNLTLGKGELHFAKFTDNLTRIPGGLRFLGNCPEFNMTVETESLDHYSSTGGIRVKDDSVTLEINTTGTISCDDADPKNVALFFLGSEATVTDGAMLSCRLVVVALTLPDTSVVLLLAVTRSAVLNSPSQFQSPSAQPEFLATPSSYSPA